MTHPDQPVSDRPVSDWPVSDWPVSDWLDARRAEIAEALAPLVRPGEPYALLDWPDHPNVGDSAIWLGEIAWVRGFLRRMPDYATACEKPAPLLDLHCPEGPVFLHGGGNFGDLYAPINDRRIELLENFRHRRIIQLPQSIHFGDPAALERMRRVIGGHPDFTLLVRDTASFEFARQQFDCDTRMCPDMALMMGALARPVAPDADVFCLMRTDGERALPDAIDAPGPAQDWLEGEPPMRTRADRVRTRYYNRAVRYRAPRLLLQPFMHRHVAMMNRIAGQRLERGIAMLGRGRQVLTDRLHAHILCTMMGIPHVVLDNSYGKLGNFITTWPADGLTRIAGSMDEARALLAEGP